MAETSQMGLPGFDPPTPTDRLMFLLYPDPPTAEAIAREARRLKDALGLRGQPLATDRFHVTLHHLGDYVGVPNDIVAKVVSLQQNDGTWSNKKNDRWMEGDTHLLDKTMIIYGSPMGDPNVHNHKRCPLFVVGGAQGRMEGNLHLRAAPGTPMANAMLTLMHRLGMDDVDSFGDSTGEFALNLGSAASPDR